jgi:peptidyl-tRNA hydrolase
MKKLYVITRKDLAPGAQACQAIHAVCEFMKEYPENYMDWYVNSNYIALLAVENEEHLKKLFNKAEYMDILSAGFCEPDFNNELTAVVLDATLESRNLVKNIKLALK